MASGGQVISTTQISFNDFFYSEDTDNGAAEGSATPGLTEGQLVSVTVLGWFRSGAPEIQIGRRASLFDPFVDDTASWTALEAFQDGDLYAQTFWRITTAGMVTAGDIYVEFPQPPLNMTTPGQDGAQVWINRWTDAHLLNKIYGVTTTGTTHTPPTDDMGVLNFYLAGGGVTTDDSGPPFPTIPGPSGGANHAIVLDDNAVGDVDHRELFGVAAYQPFNLPVEAWTTGVSQDGIMYGVADPFSVETGAPISGVVRGSPVR